MPRTARASNRGPAAAAANREAILTAARDLLAERGFQVPLSAIARQAGVSQGVFYRHFPSRLELAYAVFEENFDELEALAARADAEPFSDLWQRLITLTMTSTAFIEMVVLARPEMPDDLGSQRLEALLATPLASAQAAGVVNRDWTTADLVLILTMVHGAANSAPDQEQTARKVRRALELLGCPADGPAM